MTITIPRTTYGGHINGWLIRDLISLMGDDPDREGLKETPSRVFNSYKELFSGYQVDIASLFKTFDFDRADEMIVCRGIEFYSTCEHHLMPFVGVAHVGYIPQNGKVIGLSKLARLVEAFSRRLQLQERMTTQITDTLNEHLKPLGAGCIVRARHFCMCARGVNKQHSEMVTSSMSGVFRESQAVRQEFLDTLKV